MTKPSMKKIIIPAAAVVLLAAAAVIAVLMLSHKDAYRLVKVNSYEGEVSVSREDDGELSAFEGMKLVTEDRVDVAEESFLELLADEDKHICAEENTGFVLNASGTSESGKITIELLYGKSLFTIDNKLNEDSFFEVKTPNATLSVRGTSFSVEYNRETGETTVEVFEGKVLAESYGNEQLLKKGDFAVLPTIGEPAGDIAVLPGSPAQSKGISVTHYFSNAPDVLTAPAEYLEFFYTDNPNETVTVRPGEPDLDELSQSVIEINEQYIDPVKANLCGKLFAAMPENYLDAPTPQPIPLTDVTEYFDVVKSRTIIVKGGESDYSFSLGNVSAIFTIARMSEDYFMENCSNFPAGSVDAEGYVRCISGVQFFFYPLSESTVQLLPPSAEPSAPAEITTNEQGLCFVNCYFNSFTGPNYSDSEIQSVMLMLDQNYKNSEDKTSSNYYPFSGLPEATPLDQTNKMIYDTILTPHRALFESFLEENDDLALEQRKNGDINIRLNITEWFPNTLTINGSYRDYTAHITRAEMKIMSGTNIGESDEYVKQYPSGYYKVDEGFCYICGVSIELFGTLE